MTSNKTVCTGGWELTGVPTGSMETTIFAYIIGRDDRLGSP